MQLQTDTTYDLFILSEGVKIADLEQLSRQMQML